LHHCISDATLHTVRTTVDLPDDLHRRAVSVARDRNQSLSRTLAELIRIALSSEPSPHVAIDERTGFPIVRVGHPITSDDVRSVDDE
jgi:hypothetical protein